MDPMDSGDIGQENIFDHYLDLYKLKSLRTEIGILVCVAAMAWPKNNGFNCSRLVDIWVVKLGKHINEILIEFVKWALKY